MKHFMRLISKFLKDESGQDLIEYALVGSVIGFGAIGSLRSVATGIVGILTNLGSTIAGNI